MFFENAYRGRNNWWRWALTVICTVTVLAITMVVSDELRGEFQPDTFSIFYIGVERSLLTSIALLISVLVFVLLIKGLHKKTLTGVMTGRRRFDWKRVFFGFALWLIILTAFSFLFLDGNIVPIVSDIFSRFPLLAILPVLLFVVELAFDQISTAYGLQGLSLLLKNKILILLLLLVISLLSVLPEDEYSETRLLMIFSAMSFVLLIGLSIVLDDGMEIACGLGAAHALVRDMIVKAGSVGDPTSLASILTFVYLEAYGFAAIAAPYAIAFVIFAIVYRWKLRTLLARIERPSDSDLSDVFS